MNEPAQFSPSPGVMIVSPEELETILSAADETDALDFKQAMAWDAKTFVKDILAMANVIDGGRIVIGVEDNTWVRQGLSPEQLATYKIDTMRDQLFAFADPYVTFRMEVATDAAGLSFVIIEVQPFDEQPVICRRDGHDVTAGTIYFRSKTRRPQSAAVATSSDLREIIVRAAARSAQKLKQLGYVPALPETTGYDDELGGL